MNYFRYLLMILLHLIFVSNTTTAQYVKIKITDDLELLKISENSYIHISYFDLESSPHFPANGLIYINNGKAFIIDTPWTDELTRILINWLTHSLQVTIEGVIVTHWHIDCMGGLNEVHNAGIKSYSHKLTREIAKSKDLSAPKFEFQDSLVLSLGDKKIICKYLGAGHTNDNIVVWLPAEKILFGGCMLKALEWKSLGFTGDADLNEWPKTLKKLPKVFPDSKIVIPGHGEYGDLDLVQHTIGLFEKNK
jgi:metallo-beta-lactamase class B